MRTFVLAALLCLSATPALATPDPTAPLMGAANVSPPAPSAIPAPATVTIDAQALAQLVAKAQAASAPSTQAAPAASPSGLLGISWETLAGWLGALALMIFGLFKTAGAIKARQMLVAAAEGAWHIAERAGAIYSLDGATKGALALEAFVKAMGGSVQAPQVESARMVWEAQSAKAGLVAPTVIAPPPAVLAQAQAAAVAAKDVASKTATEIAAEAARP